MCMFVGSNRARHEKRGAVNSEGTDGGARFDITGVGVLDAVA